MTMAAAGFARGPLLGIDAAHEQLARPELEGFGFQADYGSLTVLWKGLPTITISSWTPQK